MIASRNPLLVDQDAAPAADPVFALIEEHRAAYAAWAPLALALNSLPLTDPAYAAAEEAEQGPGEREHTALAALMTATPSTLAGIAVLAGYLPGAIRQTSTDSEETEGERALRTIAAALAALAPTIPAQPPAEPDPIFGAIAAYETAWQAVEAASEPEAADGAGIAMSAAYRHLRTTRPTTPAGYAALADHLAWHIDVEPGGGNTVGEHVAAMLIAGRGALRPIAQPCNPAPLAGAGAPTLSAMSIGELADLYDVSLRASEQLAALACLPGCTGEDRARVGIVLDLEADRFGDLTMAVADELKSRLPSTDEERADWVSILAKHAARFHAWADLAALATAEASASVGGRR